MMGIRLVRALLRQTRGFASTQMGRGFMRALLRPVTIGPLIALRVGFGLLMAVSMVRFMAQGWIRELYVLPQFHFTYAGFGWVRPLPEWGLWLIFIALTLLSLAIAAGLFYRVSLLAFFLLFTYIELLDKTTYLNHYYFISLFSFLLIFLPLNGAWAMDNWLGVAARRGHVPAGFLWAVRGQLGLVYFFAGLAKINPDWLLAGQPLRIWLHARTGTPLLGPFFDQSWFPLAMSWAGMLFDLTIPFWLSWPKTRPGAYLAVIFFHGLTGLLFHIGMFPWIMIASTLVFFDWPIKTAAKPIPAVWSRPKWALLGLFFLLQILLPLRHWLIPGDVNWTEEGGRFAWRVMLVEKTGHATFYVQDEVTGRSWLVLPADYLTDLQEKQMAFQPDMLLQFAHFIATQYQFPVSVRAKVYVSWNGRPSCLLLDPAIDLLQVGRPPIINCPP